MGWLPYLDNVSLSLFAHGTSNVIEQQRTRFTARLQLVVSPEGEQTYSFFQWRERERPGSGRQPLTQQIMEITGSLWKCLQISDLEQAGVLNSQRFNGHYSRPPREKS